MSRPQSIQLACEAVPGLVDRYTYHPSPPPSPRETTPNRKQRLRRNAQNKRVCTERLQVRERTLLTERAAVEVRVLGYTTVPQAAAPLLLTDHSLEAPPSPAEFKLQSNTAMATCMVEALAAAIFLGRDGMSSACVDCEADDSAHDESTPGKSAAVASSEPEVGDMVMVHHNGHFQRARVTHVRKDWGRGGVSWIDAVEILLENGLHAWAPPHSILPTRPLPRLDEPWVDAPAEVKSIAQASTLQNNVVEPELLGKLSKLAARLLRSYLLEEDGRSLPTLASGGNFARVAPLWPSKIALQFSRTSAKARAAPQRMPRPCVACRPAGSRAPYGGAPCTRSDSCAACEECIGRVFHCPTCRRDFRVATTYEFGSGRSSIGRDRHNFVIDDFPPELEEAAAKYGPARANNCVLVALLGSAFCGRCLCGMAEHGEHDHKIGWHRDRGEGANSQAASSNVTLNVGHHRTLSTRLCTHPGQLGQQFHFTAGSRFKLCPADECMMPRVVGTDAMGSKQRVGMDAFEHAMVTPVSAKEISAGWLYREVTMTADVEVVTSRVITTAAQLKDDFEKELPCGGMNRPVEYPAAAGPVTHHSCEKLAYDFWDGKKVAYREKVAPLLDAAFAAWPAMG